MARKTAAELAEHHKALAEKHRVKAIVANDPLLRDAIALRDNFDNENALSETDAENMNAVETALKAFIAVRLAD